MNAAFYNLLLTAPAVLHLYHLRASSHAEHVVLQTAYEAATEHADNILEQVLSVNPSALDSLETLSAGRFGPNDSVRSFLEFLTAQLGEANTQFAENPAVQNVIQDALSAFRKILYQLALT